MAEITKVVKVRKCERCGREWVPRPGSRLCPGCKTAYWDVPKDPPKRDDAKANG